MYANAPCDADENLGGVEWASGQNTEDSPLSVGGVEGEGWSLVSKGLFFLVIVAAVAGVLRVKHTREQREILNEKAWNA